MFASSMFYEPTHSVTQVCVWVDVSTHTHTHHVIVKMTGRYSNTAFCHLLPACLFLQWRWGGRKPPLPVTLSVEVAYSGFVQFFCLSVLPGLHWILGVMDTDCCQDSWVVCQTVTPQNTRIDGELERLQSGSRPFVRMWMNLPLLAEWCGTLGCRLAKMFWCCWHHQIENSTKKGWWKHRSLPDSSFIKGSLSRHLFFLI